MTTRAKRSLKSTGIDATTLEANAALRSIVRRHSGESYETFSARTRRRVRHPLADASRVGPLGPEAADEGVQR